MYHPRLFGIGVIFLMLTSGCLQNNQANIGAEDNLLNEEGNSIEVWHTFAMGSTEERAFLDAIELFENEFPEIEIEVTGVPYSNADQLFMTAAQGGEAPDIIRLSSDQLGKIGDVRVNGFPLLEDMRSHYSQVELNTFETRSLQAMRYNHSLMALPASQDCLSLIYNKAIFDSRGVDYPHENWTTADFVNAAKSLTYDDIFGLALPVKIPYWWFPVQSGFGGQLFDKNGTPSLNSPGSSEAMNWTLNLELEHQVVDQGVQTVTMENAFQASKVAMVIDGPWNWATYQTSRIDLGQSVLPIVEETGQYMSPLVTYKGWAMSKQSQSKVVSAQLALWLSSAETQKNFALETYTMPTAISLTEDTDLTENEVISGFLYQAELGTPAPTTKGMSLVYGPLSTAFEQAYLSKTDDEMTSSIQQILDEANRQLESLMEA